MTSKDIGNNKDNTTTNNNSSNNSSNNNGNNSNNRHLSPSDWTHHQPKFPALASLRRARFSPFGDDYMTSDSNTPYVSAEELAMNKRIAKLQAELHKLEQENEAKSKQPNHSNNNSNNFNNENKSNNDLNAPFVSRNDGVNGGARRSIAAQNNGRMGRNGYAAGANYNQRPNNNYNHNRNHNHIPSMLNNGGNANDAKENEATLTLENSKEFQELVNTYRSLARGVFEEFKKWFVDQVNNGTLPTSAEAIYDAFKIYLRHSTVPGINMYSNANNLLDAFGKIFISEAQKRMANSLNKMLYVNCLLNLFLCFVFCCLVLFVIFCSF